ncbi:MAG: hypothetical protein HQL11_05650 [Candidatus Omnitrophica bacterium]|nr:hypothetical protein [Candidatus Omnitrophota bacterium]
MSEFLIRVWQPANIENIKSHILIVGDLTADCGHCRALGLKYAEVHTCPECGNEFMFITARSASGNAKSIGGVVRRIKSRRPDLTFVDYDDFQALIGKQTARDFFG